jgi:hypothetical protein
MVVLATSNELIVRVRMPQVDRTHDSRCLERS